MSREKFKRALVAALLVSAPALAIGQSTSTPASAVTATPMKVLFDNTSAETAGNADWIISTSQPDPLKQNANPSSEGDWTGALSAWGVALQKTGNYSLSTLPDGGQITYGDSSNPEDLSNYNVFVLPEPNILFTAAEKTAIMNFVKNGGGLFMISDHNGSDRNNDGADSVKILNDLMTNNSVDSSDPFGFSIDVSDLSTDNPNVIGSQAGSDPIITGPFGKATGTIIRDGTTATLKPSDNSAVRGEIFKTGASASGTTGAAFVTSTFGSGRVAYWGDSSPIDDGTGQSGNNLYDGWNDPAGTDSIVALNATQWLAGGSTTGGGGTGGGSTPTQHALNGGFESGTADWTLAGGATVTTSRAADGTHSLQLGGSNSSTQTVSQKVTVPTGASSQTLSFKSYVTTQETGTTAYDKLNVQVNGSTVKTFSNASTKGSWVGSSVDLSSYAGQTVTITFQATNGTKLPTTFNVDAVSVLA